MLRPSSLPRALAAVAAAGLAVLTAAVGVPTASPSYAGSLPADPSQPLVLRMRSITPDYIPQHGPIVIHGTVTNVSDQTWTAINVEGFVGSVPITTTAGLAAAARTPVDADVGHRITDPGTFDHVDSLTPGATASFTVRLPRSKIDVSAPGVYWFGVHALGSTAAGRSVSADGRDRTFLPLVPASVTASGRVEQASLVLPVRAGVTRGADGTVEDPQAWLRSLRSGPLHDVLAAGLAAGGRPLTWVVDPAVLDVVRSLARGNPARTLVTPGTKTPGGPTPSGSPSASGSATATGDDSVAATSTTARVARQWLRDLHGVLSADTGQVLGLPYGDLAVESALRDDPSLLGAAIRRTGHALSPWRLPLSPVIAPPTGQMAGSVVASAPRASTVLLDDTAVRGSAPPAVTTDGRRVVISSTGAAEGGPGPADPQSPLALRQRLLSEAAIRLLDDQAPLVVQLPTAVAHRIRPAFFSGLDVPWLRLTTLDGATAGATPDLRVERYRDPDTSAAQLDATFYSEANSLVESAAVLQSVVPGNTVLRRQIFAETAGNASYAAAKDPAAALARLRTTAGWVSGNLDGVDLAAPPKVTLASDNGHFSALVSNGLDVPVRVTVRAVADPQLRITGGETVDLPAHGRTSVLLNASTHVLGVHSVTLQLTNKAGRPLGASDTFPIRAEAVSRLIWVILGAGVVLLFGAVVVRLARRIVRSGSS